MRFFKRMKQQISFLFYISYSKYIHLTSIYQGFKSVIIFIFELCITFIKFYFILILVSFTSEELSKVLVYNEQSKLIDSIHYVFIIITFSFSCLIAFIKFIIIELLLIKEWLLVTKKQQNDRRKHYRYSSTKKVRFLINSTIKALNVINISKGGMCILVDKTFIGVEELQFDKESFALNYSRATIQWIGEFEQGYYKAGLKFA